MARFEWIKQPPKPVSEVLYKATLRKDYKTMLLEFPKGTEFEVLAEFKAEDGTHCRVKNPATVPDSTVNIWFKKTELLVAGSKKAKPVVVAKKKKKKAKVPAIKKAPAKVAVKPTAKSVVSAGSWKKLFSK